MQSDLFHKDVPFEFIDKVFAVMALTPHITYMILTKRPERMAEYLNAPDTWQSITDQMHETGSEIEVTWSKAQLLTAYGKTQSEWDRVYSTWPLPNVWLGTSVEDQPTADERIPHLLRCPAAVRFLSCEPLLGTVGLDRYLAIAFHFRSRMDANTGHRIGETQSGWIRQYRRDGSLVENDIHWVIVGGESGPGARPMHPDWARSIRDQCVAAGVPFFFKQWGAYKPISTTEGVQCLPWGDYNPETGHGFIKTGKKVAGRLLDGQEWSQFPETREAVKR